MSSFTDELVVKKLDGRWWEVCRSFRYYIGKEDSDIYIEIPEGFVTDFASVPRAFWSIIPPDGRYSQAAVLHDYLYQKKLLPRKRCDLIFLEAMKVLKVPGWKRFVMYRALRMFGWISWRK